MTKKIIFQINIPNEATKNLTVYSYHQEMYYTSERNARQYAQRCHADYYKITTPDDFKPAAGKHLDYQKLKFYDFEDYNQIVYFDSDYIIKENAPDLFLLCKNKFHAVTDPGKTVEELAMNLGVPRERYFNAGFMYIPKSVIERTKNSVAQYLSEEYEYQGQGLLNKLFYDHQIDYSALESDDWNPVKRTFGTYADHYAGSKKKKWGMVSY
jgi:lipopolysaccharide biosynthesis glycosyltransferase